MDLRDRLLKFSALKEELPLQPHQERARDEAEDEKPYRKLLVHSLGSGKSRSAITVAETKGGPYAAIVPASLRVNFNKEVDKWTDGSTRPDLLSFNSIAKGQPANEYNTLVVDEAQGLRNPASQRSAQTKALAAKTPNLVLLSGTPIVNAPSDLVPMIEMLTGQKMTPETFNDKFVGEKTVSPGIGGWLRGVPPVKQKVMKNKEQFQNLLRGYVDYHEPSKPAVEREDEQYDVSMSPEQDRFYRAFWDQLPTVLRWKLQYDYPLTTQELNNLSSFMAGPRQVSLSILPFMRGKHDPLSAFNKSPKLTKAFELAQEARTQDPNAKVVAFSNFLQAGLEPYAAALAANNVPYGIFHGGLSDGDRKRVIEDYNTGKIKQLLIGPSGSEGISLKGTNLLQVLDPHWNKARVEQSIGRGIRFDSHIHLPEDQRRVRVQRFRSKTPTGFWDRVLRRLMLYSPDTSASDPGSDSYLENMADRKNQLNTQFMAALREVGSAARS